MKRTTRNKKNIDLGLVIFIHVHLFLINLYIYIYLRATAHAADPSSWANSPHAFWEGRTTRFLARHLPKVVEQFGDISEIVTWWKLSRRLWIVDATHGECWDQAPGSLQRLPWHPAGFYGPYDGFVWCDSRCHCFLYARWVKSFKGCKSRAVRALKSGCKSLTSCKSTGCKSHEKRL